MNTNVVRTILLQFLALVALVLVAAGAFADTSDDLEGLGGNRQVNDRAAGLENRTRMGIVQGRAVDRNWRFELGASYGAVAYGDSYVNTQDFGLNADLHINPRFSVGVHYAHAFNQLTNEGQAQFDQARSSNQSTGSFQTPQVSWPQDQLMGVINWYMTYGKLNFFDLRTVQFDVYSLAGYGQVQVATEIDGQTQSSWTGTWTAGGGIGFWFSQHLSARFELRYQNYSEQVYTGNQNLNLIVGTLGIGVLL